MAKISMRTGNPTGKKKRKQDARAVLGALVAHYQALLGVHALELDGAPASRSGLDEAACGGDSGDESTDGAGSGSD